MNELLGLAALVVVILVGSAVCSGVEAAILTVNPLRVLELTSRVRPVRGAHALLALKNRMGRPLAVLVIFNNAFNIFGSLMLGSYAGWAFSKLDVARMALPLFSVGLTLLVILLGEILPKALGSRLSLPVSLVSAAPLNLLTRLMLPLVLVLEKLLPAITAESEITTDEAEIRQLARLGSQKGHIEADEAAMISKVFQLNDLTARDLMVPRVSAPTLSGKDRLDSVRDQLLTHQAAWWVVLGEEVDEILGVASRERLLSALVEGQGHTPVLSLTLPVEFVPEMIRADRLLTAFRRSSHTVRVVVDEFGGFVGLIGADAVLAVLAGWWRRPQSATETAEAMGPSP